MATSSGDYLDSNSLGQSAPLVGAIGIYTVALTAAFVGMVALASGNAVGFLTRMPVYVLASSIAFVGVLIAADGPHVEGPTVLTWAVAASVGEFFLITLATEGMVYALTEPQAVVASHMFVYLLSAAVIASGLGYWGVRNWRQVSGVVGGRQL